MCSADSAESTSRRRPVACDESSKVFQRSNHLHLRVCEIERIPDTAAAALDGSSRDLPKKGEHLLLPHRAEPPREVPGGPVAELELQDHLRQRTAN